MKFKETKIKGLYIIEPDLKIDNRGYFTRIFCEEEFKKAGLDFKIIQANLSSTKKKGTIRGMHFQKLPKAEDKIVQCIKGSVYDVVVDLRKDSLTYGHWVAEELSEENKKMFLIPKGFAHGFQTLTDNCELLYFISEFYSPGYATGVCWNDPFLNIKWPIENHVLSEKDKNWPLMKQK
jgi:dTDP-4-dehydrorhamnose 3,5-epimerase